jgi:hypothetical protein
VIDPGLFSFSSEFFSSACPPWRELSGEKKEASISFLDSSRWMQRFLFHDQLIQLLISSPSGVSIMGYL